MTRRARLPTMITKFGDLMIIVTPCPPSYHHDPGVSGQSGLLRAPSTDYAKTVHKQQGAAFAHLVPTSGGMLGQVPDVAGHVVGDEPPDGVARVHGDPHRPVRRQDEAGRLQVVRFVVDVRARRRGDLAGVRAVPDGEAQLCLAMSAAEVSSSSTDSATSARENAASCALQYGHQDPR
jgi:hypothetical protein